MADVFRVWFNGDEITSPADASIELALDRANTFGDGVFETMFVHQGRLHLLDRHMQRLYTGLTRLHIQCANELIQQDIARVLAAVSDSPKCYILKLVLSRGSSQLGYSTKGLSCNRMLLLKSYLPAEQTDCTVMICETPLGSSPALAGLKHCNRLEQVLAKSEVESAGFDDGIMLDQQASVIESTCANVFIVEDDQLITPPIVQSGVKGVMRDTVLQQFAPQLGISVSEEPISLERLYQSDGCGLSNAVQGVKWVSQCRQQDGQMIYWQQQNSLLASLQLAIQKSMFRE